MPGWNDEMQIGPPAKTSIATEAGTFTAVAEVGQQLEPGTPGYEALQTDLAEAVTSDKPAQVVVQKEASAT